MSKSDFDNQAVSIDTSSVETETSSLGFLRSAWEALRPRKLEEFPAYGKKEPDPPSNWKTLSHHYNFENKNKYADLVLSETENPSRIVLYALGWKSSPVEKQKVIDGFNALGATVIVLPLTKSHDIVGTMEENIERIGSLVFDPNSVMHKYNSKSLPIHIVTHSTGGNAYMHALQRKSDQIKSVRNIMGTYHTAPFVDAENASAKHNPVKSILYHSHAMSHKDQYVGTTFLDRLYYFFNGLADRILTEDPANRPTHGQNMELIAYGHLLDDITEQMIDNNTLHDIPRETYLYSHDDDFAAEGDILDLAHLRQIPENRVISVAGGHSILEVPKNRELINTMMQKNEEEHFAYINRPILKTLVEENDFLEQIKDLLDFPEVSDAIKNISGAQTDPSTDHAPSHS